MLVLTVSARGRVVVHAVVVCVIVAGTSCVVVIEISCAISCPQRRVCRSLCVSGRGWDVVCVVVPV